MTFSREMPRSPARASSAMMASRRGCEAAPASGSPSSRNTESCPRHLIRSTSRPESLGARADDVPYVPGREEQERENEYGTLKSLTPHPWNEGIGRHCGRERETQHAP